MTAKMVGEAQRKGGQGQGGVDGANVAKDGVGANIEILGAMHGQIRVDNALSRVAAHAARTGRMVGAPGDIWFAHNRGPHRIKDGRNVILDLRHPLVKGAVLGEIDNRLLHAQMADPVQVRDTVAGSGKYLDHAMELNLAGARDKRIETLAYQPVLHRLDKAC